MNLEELQQGIQANGVDGWLFFDHHRRDTLAYRILGMIEDAEPTRRWYYFIPAKGEPRKLVHRIESRVLDGLPGKADHYSSWVDQHSRLAAILDGCSRIAMQYSPNCAIPYVSLVDGGTLELIRSFGVDIVSSANLVQEFEARWSEEQLQSHLKAGVLVDQARREAFELIGGRVRADATVTDYEVQQFVLRRFAETGLATSHGPIVATNEQASDPHYEPCARTARRIKPGDLVLIDLWAKLKRASAVYYDVTWTGYCGDNIPAKIQNVFEIVRDARRKATQLVIDKVARATSVSGFEVDDAARNYIEDRGFGEFFFHRTGHSIGTDVHGTGANMDNLESHDERKVIARTCFSIEPGIYLPEFGIRSEVNVYVGDNEARVTGEEQDELIRI